MTWTKVVPRLLFALAVAVVAVCTFAVLRSDRTTREELFKAASQPDAAQQYDYIFSKEELSQMEPKVKPYNCRGPEGRLTSREEYVCGTESAMVTSGDEFVPFGYMYQTSLFNKRGKWVGIRVVKTPAWKPGLTAEPSLQPKSPGDGPTPPSGKPLASSPTR